VEIPDKKKHNPKSLQKEITIEISKSEPPTAKDLGKLFGTGNMPVLFYGKPGMPIRYILESRENAKRVY